MPWLIEAYRTSHGPSFWREVLTVAMGDFPDADDIRVFVSFPTEEGDLWRNMDTGEIVSFANNPWTSTWLDEQCANKLGVEPGILGMPTHWRNEDGGE